MQHNNSAKIIWIWGPGCYCESGAGIVSFPLQKGGFFHAWVQKCDSWSKFHHVFVPRQVLGQTIPLQQKKSERFAPLGGLGAWACLLGKNGAFVETLETRFLATT